MGPYSTVEQLQESPKSGYARLAGVSKGIVHLYALLFIIVHLLLQLFGLLLKETAFGAVAPMLYVMVDAPWELCSLGLAVLLLTAAGIRCRNPYTIGAGLAGVCAYLAYSQIPMVVVGANSAAWTGLFVSLAAGYLLALLAAVLAVTHLRRQSECGEEEAVPGPKRGEKVRLCFTLILGAFVIAWGLVSYAQAVDLSGWKPYTYQEITLLLDHSNLEEGISDGEDGENSIPYLSAPGKYYSVIVTPWFGDADTEESGELLEQQEGLLDAGAAYSQFITLITPAHLDTRESLGYYFPMTMLTGARIISLGDRSYRVEVLCVSRPRSGTLKTIRTILDSVQLT